MRLRPSNKRNIMRNRSASYYDICANLYSVIFAGAKLAEIVRFKRSIY